MMREEGVTRVSLKNGRLLKELHGAVASVVPMYDAKDWYQTHVTYEDGYQHVFTGFSWSYSGEGPRGLLEWAKEA